MNSVNRNDVPGLERVIFGASFTLAVICYLVAGTGIFSDDYALILTLRGLTPDQMIWPTPGSIATPLTHLTHAWLYYVVQDGPLYIYDCIKAIYLFLSIMMLRQFFGLWFGPHKSLVVAGLFAFYPIHDAVTYWFIGQYLLLSIAFYAYSFYLLQCERPVSAFAAGILGSFVSYGSPAVAFGFSFIFALRRDFRRAFLLILPNLIYVTYYLIVVVYLGKGVARIPGILDFANLSKQFLLQIATFVDAAIGPSFWLKILLAFGEISLTTAFVVGAVLFVVVRLPKDPARAAVPRELIFGALGMTIAAFGMFAITGRYPQLAFNLGDRVTIFGNFLMVVLIASLPLGRAQWFAVVGAYLIAIGGISDHWKGWQLQQQAVIRNIAINPELRKIEAGATLYVTGNQYSNFGRISHIEFLSESFVASSVFALSLRPTPEYQVVSLNRRYHFDGEYLIDRKYGDRLPVSGSIRVYDSIANRIVAVPAVGINQYIDQLPVDRRIWIQFLGDGPIRRAVLLLMPRLEYAF